MSDPLARSRSGYIPTLDGWRAVAILCVMVYHGSPIVVGGLSLRPAQNLGRYGVHLFFAISGILICTRLVDEEERRGSISLGAFYTRRIFRIQPAALVVLGTILLLSGMGEIPWNGRGWWMSLLSVRNFYHSDSIVNGSIYTNHFWSLAVEEHFYLFLPLLLILLRGPRRIWSFALPTGLSVAWLFFLQHFYALTPGIDLRTDFVLCFLFVPAWLALLVRRPAIRASMAKYLSPSVMLVVVVAGVAVLGIAMQAHFLVKFLLATVSLLVLSTILHPESWVGRCLEFYPLRVLGRISYSVYLWQQFFCRDAEIIRPERGLLGYSQHFPMNVICSLGFGLMSYFLIEKPIIRFGHRLFPPVTPGHTDLQDEPPGKVA